MKLPKKLDETWLRYFEDHSEEFEPMTKEQREWCYTAIDKCGDDTRFYCEPYKDFNDKDLAGAVLTSWWDHALSMMP
jgi:hypothetical protein